MNMLFERKQMILDDILYAYNCSCFLCIQFSIEEHQPIKVKSQDAEHLQVPVQYSVLLE